MLGAAVGIAGIAIAYFVWVRAADRRRRAPRFAPLHTLFVNKWYFDELIGVLVVRPPRGSAPSPQKTSSGVFVNGLLVGGTTGIVRAGSALVRAAQTGFLRYYAPLMLLGMAASASTS